MSYEVLKNRLCSGKEFDLDTARERISALADQLMITQVQADELLALAQENASKPDRLTMLELAVAELGFKMAGGEVDG